MLPSNKKKKKNVELQPENMGVAKKEEPTLFLDYKGHFFIEK